ncbi:hypothetical protein [Methanosphaera sp.]
MASTYKYNLQINTKTDSGPLKTLVSALDSVTKSFETAKKASKGLDNLSITVNTKGAVTNINAIASSTSSAEKEVKGLDNESITLNTNGAVKGLQSVGDAAGTAKDEINGFDPSAVNGVGSAADNAADSFDNLARSAGNANKATSKASKGSSRGSFSQSLSSMSSGLSGSGMLSYLGMGTAYDAVIGNSMTKEINRVTSKQRGYQIDGAGGLDEITNKSLVKMNNLIPAMNANQSALNVNMMDYAQTIANVGSKVKALGYSEAESTNAMYDLSKGINGAFASLDQYGISKQALLDTGLWSGEADDIKGYFAAVDQVIGDTSAYTNTLQGDVTELGKKFSSAGGKVGEKLNGPLRGVVQTLNKFLDANPEVAQGLMTAFLAFSAVQPAVDALSTVTSTFDTIKSATKGAVGGVKDLVSGFKNLKKSISEKGFKGTILDKLKGSKDTGMDDPCSDNDTCVENAQRIGKEKKKNNKQDKKSSKTKKKKEKGLKNATNETVGSVSNPSNKQRMGKNMTPKMKKRIQTTPKVVGGGHRPVQGSDWGPSKNKPLGKNNTPKMIAEAKKQNTSSLSGGVNLGKRAGKNALKSGQSTGTMMSKGMTTSMGKSSKGIFSKLKGPMGTVGSKLGSSMGSLAGKGMSSAIGKVAGGIGSKLAGGLLGCIPIVGQLFLAFSAITTVLDLLGIDWMTPLMSGIQGIVGVLTGALQPAFAWLQANGPAIFDGILQAIQPIWDALVELGSTIMTALQPAFAWLQANGPAIWDGLVAGIQFLMPILSFLGQMFITAIVTPIQGAIQVITTLVNILSWLVSTAQMVFSTLASLPQIISGAWSGLVGLVSGILSNVGGAISSFASSAASKMRSAGSKMVSNLRSGLSNIAGTVSSELKGAIDSLISIGGEMANKALEIGKQIWQSMKAGLGVGSPGYIWRMMEAEMEGTHKTLASSEYPLTTTAKQIGGNIATSFNNQYLSSDSMIPSLQDMSSNLPNVSLPSIPKNNMNNNEKQASGPTAPASAVINNTFNISGSFENEDGMNKLVEKIIDKMNFENTRAGRTVGTVYHA